MEPFYEDSQIHQTDDKTPEVMDKKKNQPVESIRQVNHSLLQETLANSQLLQTKTTKIKRIQELVVPKISKNPDFIKAITEHKRFNIRKIFDLLLEVTIREFPDCLDTTICELAFNI